MLATVILLQALPIMSMTPTEKKMRAACPRPNTLMKRALYEHNRRRSDLALGKVRTESRNMWRAAFMMELKENCWVTKKLKALNACSHEVFDRSISGIRNTHTIEAYSELDALIMSISHWWSEVKRHPRPNSLRIKHYLTNHTHFLPMALSYQEYVSCSVNLCDDHKKKEKFWNLKGKLFRRRKYFVQCLYSAMPDRNQRLYEKGKKCSKYCDLARKEQCVEGLCRVPDYQSNFVY